MHIYILLGTLLSSLAMNSGLKCQSSLCVGYNTACSFQASSQHDGQPPSISQKNSPTMGQPPFCDQESQSIRWGRTGLMVHAEVLLKTTFRLLGLTILFFTTQLYLKP